MKTSRSASLARQKKGDSMSKVNERKAAKVAAKEAKMAAAKKAAEEEEELGDGIGTVDDRVHEMYSAREEDDEDRDEARAKMKKRLAEAQAQLDEIRAKDGTVAGVPKKPKALSFRWTKVETDLLPNVPHPPEPRSGHAAWTISDGDPRIFIHGGAGAADDRGETNKDVEHIYALNTESLRWNISHTYCKPRHRTYHTVSVIGPNTKLPEHLQIPRLLCFGGYNAGSIEHDNFALIKWSVFLEGESHHMRMPPRGLPDKPKEIQGIKDVWQHLEKLHTGDIPLGRCNHTATLVGSSILVIYGGWHTDFVDDVYTLDCTSWRWTHRQPKLEVLEQLHGNPVAPRAGHTATLLPGRKLLIYGGQNKSGPLGDLALLDLTNMTWYRPKPSGRTPSKRSGHTANYKDGQVFIYGGWDGIRQRDDLHVLSVSGDPMTEWRWEQVNVGGARVGGRVGHTATFVGSRLFVIGGWSNGAFHNDVHVLQTATGVSKVKRGIRALFGKRETMLEKLTNVVVDKEEMRSNQGFSDGMKKLDSMHTTAASKIAEAEEEEANFAALNERVDKQLERAIGVVEARKLQAEKANADRIKEARRAKQQKEGEYRKQVIAIGLKRGMTLSEAMAVAERGETLKLPEEEDDRIKPPPLELLEQNPIIKQEDIDAMPTSYETATTMQLEQGLDMLDKIAATGGLAATYEEDADGDGIPDFLQAEGEDGGSQGNVAVLQGAYAAAYAREKNKYKAMKREKEGKNMRPITKGIHRPKRGPDHDRNGIKLTLEELREEKRAAPLTRQEPTAVLPPLAASGSDADAGSYALSSTDRALVVTKVNDLKLLRRAFVGDYLSTSTSVVPGGSGGGGGPPGSYAASAGLPLGIYKIISRMQAMARGYLTRKRMLEMKAVMRIQAMVRGRIARRKALEKSGGRTFDAFVGTAKETKSSKFKRVGSAIRTGVRLGGGTSSSGGLLSRLSGASGGGGSVPESPLSTPSITDSESEGEVSDSEDDDEDDDGDDQYAVESDDDI